MPAVDADFLRRLRAAAGATSVLDAPADRHVYGGDNSRLHQLPAAVVLARDEAQLQAVVALAAERRVPITARGRGTATTGAAVPVEAGIVVSFERMDQLSRIAHEPGGDFLHPQPLPVVPFQDRASCEVAHAHC